MRLVPAALLAATLSAAVLPATAQETLSDRVAEAYQDFAQNLVPGAMFDGQYFDAVTAGIDGNWVLASVLIEATDDLAALDQRIIDTCTADGPGITRLAVSGPYAFTASRGGPAASVTVTFVYAGGAMFASQVDTTEFLTYLGLIGNENAGQPIINALMSSTAPVMIFRPSEDVLAVVRTRGGGTDIYARCPVDDGAGVDSAALEAALGKAFDAQFPKAKKPEVRADFIACAVEALSPLPASDIQLAIDTDFDPPAEDQERIDAAYPEVNDTARLCAETAAAALGR